MSSTLRSAVREVGTLVDHCISYSEDETWRDACLHTQPPVAVPIITAVRACISLHSSTAVSCCRQLKKVHPTVAS